MSNPTGINQYTRHGAGALRTKTGKFYHGTPKTFAGAVQPQKHAGHHSDPVFAIAGIKQAREYSKGHGDKQKVGRILQVQPNFKGTKFDGREGKIRRTEGKVVVRTPKAMSVVRTLPTLHKPSRK